jgi:hypothetical protein
VAVSLCAIASSTLTLAAYFRIFDSVVHSLAQSQREGTMYDAKSLYDAALFPAGLGEFFSGPTASS